MVEEMRNEIKVNPSLVAALLVISLVGNVFSVVGLFWSYHSGLDIMMGTERFYQLEYANSLLVHCRNDNDCVGYTARMLVEPITVYADKRVKSVTGAQPEELSIKFNDGTSLSFGDWQDVLQIYTPSGAVFYGISAERWGTFYLRDAYGDVEFMTGSELEIPDKLPEPME